MKTQNENEESVSELWQRVHSAAYAYRKRAERTRQAIGSNVELSRRTGAHE